MIAALLDHRRPLILLEGLLGAAWSGWAQWPDIMIRDPVSVQGTPTY